MNRQFRRAQEKQDKKQQKEKTRRRQERKAKVRQMRQARSQKNDRKQARLSSAGKEEGKPTPPASRSRGRLPGRFSGVLAAVTVFFIALQGAAPQPEQAEAWWGSLVYPGFYLMLGYFATLWFMRRDTARAVIVSIVGGTLLGISVAVAQVVQGNEVDLLSHALVIPVLVAGALLGRLVFVATPR